MLRGGWRGEKAAEEQRVQIVKTIFPKCKPFSI